MIMLLIFFWFIEIFRLSNDSTRRLINLLQPFLFERTRSHGISIEIMIITALRFYASGSYQRGIGQDFNIGLSQTSVHRCIHTATEAIARNLSRIYTYIKFPQIFNERQQIKMGLFNNWGLPGVIGAIDCTHVAILKPAHEEHNFINRKGYHSLNVQVVCDHEMVIRNVNSNYGGSTHDSFIWRQSELQNFMNNLYINNEVNTWLIGDSGYPLQPYLLTPINNAAAGSPQATYNNAHILVRNVIERCFGNLEMRFRCLLKERVARYSPQFVSTLIVACCTLRNYCIAEKIPLLHDDNQEEDNDNGVPLVGAHMNDLHREGERIRALMIERYFN